MRYHAVPSLAMAHGLGEPGAASVANRLCATTVFGVVVTLRNVTVFDVSMLHGPVNVQMRNTRRCGNS